MSTSPRVEYRCDNQVWVVIMDAPQKRNAVDAETARNLAAIFARFQSDQIARCAILYGVGNFCAGADLQSMSQGFTERMNSDMSGLGPMGPSRMLLTKPVIAAVAGYAVAGGLELACWCDLRVVEEDAVFGVFCRRWGVPLIDGGTVRLPRLIGLSRAMDLILTGNRQPEVALISGRPVKADEAFQIGLANRVVPKGQALAAAEELAKLLISFPQECLRADRLSAYQQHNLSMRDALANEWRLGATSEVLRGALSGAEKFKRGEGRHGSFSAFGAPKL